MYIPEILQVNGDPRNYAVFGLMLAEKYNLELVGYNKIAGGYGEIVYKFKIKDKIGKPIGSSLVTIQFRADYFTYVIKSKESNNE